MKLRNKGCHDCLLLGFCNDPKAHYDSDYRCDKWEWKYE